PLMGHVEIAVDHVVGFRRGKEFLHQRLHGRIAGEVGLRLRWIGWENGAPQAGWSVRRHLEAVAPRAGVGEIAARAIAALAFEVIRRGEDDEALGPGEALERDAALLAHHAAAPARTHQVDAGVTSQPAGTADLDADGIRRL